MRSIALPTCTALVVLLGLAAGPSVARADAEKAREYFKQAKQAYADEQYERAAELLEKAYSEEANLTYQYNRIRALQGAGKYGKALEVLKTYEQPMLDAEGFEDIREIKESLQQKVDTGSSENSSGEATSGATGGDSGSGTTAPSSSGSTKPKRKSNPGMRALGWGLAGAGVASIGMGTLFGSLALLPPDIRRDARNDEVKPDDVDVVRSHRTATIIFLAAGTGALIGGGVLLYNQYLAEPQKSAHRGMGSAQIRWRPFATPEAAGATLEIQF